MGRHRRTEPPQEHRDIINAYRTGVPGTELADRYGLTRQRIQAILARWGLDRTDGGVSFRVRLREAGTK